MCDIMMFIYTTFNKAQTVPRVYICSRGCLPRLAPCRGHECGIQDIYSLTLDCPVNRMTGINVATQRVLLPAPPWVDCVGAVKKSPQLIAQLGSEQEPSPRTEPRLAEGGAVARGSTVVLRNCTFDLKSEKMLMAQICISK